MATRASNYGAIHAAGVAHPTCRVPIEGVVKEQSDLFPPLPLEEPRTSVPLPSDPLPLVPLPAPLPSDPLPLVPLLPVTNTWIAI